MKAKIKFFGAFHRVTDTESAELEFPTGANLKDVLEIIENKFGEKFSKLIRGHLDYLMIFTNNIEHRRLQGLRTKINDGDKVLIGHVAGGG